MSERKRSSLSRRVVSASSFCSIAVSFCSMMAPAIRMTKKRTKAPITVSEAASDLVSSEGSQPRASANWPTVMPMTLHSTVVRQTREPARARFSRAMKMYAAHRTGPHPVR